MGREGGPTERLRLTPSPNFAFVRILRASARDASEMFRSVESDLKSRSFSRWISCIAITGGVFGLRHSPAATA